MSFLSEYTDDYFKRNGLLEEAFERFEYRDNQHRMAADVSKIFEKGGVAVLEAGTGIGKTFAYLIPAILSGERVVIATKSKNLQEQLFFQDLQFVKKIVPFDFKTIYIKGRSNYICLDKLSKISVSNVFFKNKVIKLINNWVKRSKFGDISELNEISGSGFLHTLTSSSETCKGTKCAFFKDCFVYKLKLEAEKSDVIVVNYHLLFADYRIKNQGFGKVLPEYKYLICDEAHSIEDIATEYLGDSVSKYQVSNLLSDLEGNSFEGVEKLRNAGDEFFLALTGVVKENSRAEINSVRNDKLEEKAGDFINMLSEVATNVKNSEHEEAELFLARIENCMNIIDKIFFDKQFLNVKWIERSEKNISLKCFPVDVSSDLEQLFYNLKGVVFTSATLAVNENFDFFKKRTGLHLTDIEEIYPSSFDFSKQALLFTPENIPEPSSKNFVMKLSDELTELIEITKGNAFLLFTNLKNMNAVAKHLKEKTEYNILVQGESSNINLIERFKKEKGSVLLGSYSFWEGIDIQGNSLTLVAIEKFPFAVPSDPLKNARIEMIKENQGNPFYEYQIPEAVMLLKQGIGRLIRSSKDKGIIAIFDIRLMTKSYGKIFLKNLPQMKRVLTLRDAKKYFAQL
jgi:ATP-dependent DNA helicase DinG